ncbi:MAG: Sec-independent protein translocase subunit TatA/TatB [Bryobacteraceae bacterium]
MLSLPHLVLLFLIALIVFGPEKLPELARMLGKAMAEFRRVTTDVRRVVEDEMRDIERQARDADYRRQQAAQTPPAALPQAPPGGPTGPSAAVESGPTHDDLAVMGTDSPAPGPPPGAIPAAPPAAVRGELLESEAPVPEAALSGAVDDEKEHSIGQADAKQP